MQEFWNARATRLQLGCNWVAMGFLFVSPAVARIMYFPDEEEGLKLLVLLQGWDGHAFWCVLVGEIAGMRLQLTCN